MPPPMDLVTVWACADPPMPRSSVRDATVEHARGHCRSVMCFTRCSTPCRQNGRPFLNQFRTRGSKVTGIRLAQLCRSRPAPEERSSQQFPAGTRR